jgi:cyclophilin family peptidyl-prolyl cis-trans isomerase
MLKKLAVTLALVCGLGVAVMTGQAQAQTQDPENTLYLDLNHGRVVIQLLPEVAPKTVARIKELTRQGFYDGVVFHRVIQGFMAQTGDPTGTGRGGSGHNISAEFSGLQFDRGTVAMARAASVDSADSQFFICYAPTPSLFGKYTIFGKVIDGMQFVDQIKPGDPNDNGAVMLPDKIVKMQVAADAK